MSVPATRKLLKASGSGASGSGGTGTRKPGEGEMEEQTAQQKVQGYDVLYPSEDRGDNWAPPSRFRVDRYVNGRSRLIGGVLLTTQLGEVAPPEVCTGRFPTLVAQGGCLHADKLQSTPYGMGPV